MMDKNKIIYQELSYKLIGLAYEAANSLGYGLKEDVYKKSYAILLSNESIPYKKEFFYNVNIRGENVAKKFFDFLIDDKIIIEFKIGSRNYRDSYKQLLDYLKLSGYKLGIIIRITADGVKIKRIANFY